MLRIDLKPFHILEYLGGSTGRTHDRETVMGTIVFYQGIEREFGTSF